MRYVSFTFSNGDEARCFESLVSTGQFYEPVQREGSWTWSMAFPSEVSFEDAAKEIEDYLMGYGFFAGRDYQFN